MKYLLFTIAFITAYGAKCQVHSDIFIYQQHVDSLVKWVTNDEVEKIADKLIYPLNRDYPLPDIQNRNEFIAYYDTLFDDSLKTILTTATSSQNWTNMKDKGVRLNSGIMWFSHNLDFMVINYSSQNEQLKRQRLLNNDLNSINPSLRGFQEPIMKLKTHNHIIRIDQVNNNNFRYCAWDLSDSTINTPKFVIQGGIELKSHSPLCPFYKFTSTRLTYKVYAGCMVSGYGYENLTPKQTGYISIEQDGREIKKEKIVELKR